MGHSASCRPWAKPRGGDQRAPGDWPPHVGLQLTLQSSARRGGDPPKAEWNQADSHPAGENMLTDDDKLWMTGAIGIALDATQDRLVEVMRKIQTELLRGMAAHSASVTIRMRKIEADQSNLDAALSGRVEILEKRLLEIEQRLGLPPIQ
jgi:hypothetical protein